MMAAGFVPEIPFGGDPAYQAVRPNGCVPKPTRRQLHGHHLTAAPGPRTRPAQHPARRTGDTLSAVHPRSTEPDETPGPP